jgi:hypothetical protein
MEISAVKSSLYFCVISCSILSRQILHWFSGNECADGN